MKAQILESLQKIEQVAKETRFKGSLSLKFDRISIAEWDKVIESITEYPRYKHNVTVAEGVEVALLLN